MDLFFGSLLEIVASPQWLVAANFILSTLLGLSMLRYHGLYYRAREEQKNSRDLIENLSEGIYRSSPDGRQLSANRALVKLNGYSSEEEMLADVKDIGKKWYVEPTRRDEFQAILRRDGYVEDFISEVYRYKTRERIWISELARLVCSPKTGRPLFYEGSVREITETMKRLRLEEQFQKLTRQLPGGLFQFVRHTDGSHSVHYLSPGFWKIAGLPTSEKMETPGAFERCLHPEDRAEYYRTLNELAERLEPWVHEFRIITSDGVEKWLRVSGRPEADAEGVTWHGYLDDISVRKRQEMEIEDLAYFDPLTALPNRRLLLTRMAQAIAGCSEHGEHGALLFIDLDNFKTLNDTQGHDIGDAFLVQVAERLRRCLAARDTVARIGGDEFVVILHGAGAERPHATRRAILAANQVLAALRTAFELGTLRHVASASVGVVVFDGQEKRPDELLKRADIAMYQAKGAGRNGVALFDPSTMDRETERYQLMSDLRAGLAEGQLDLHFQPLVSHEGVISGAEALIRWNHPRLGMVLPDRFVPLAEQFGLNDELGRFVLQRGLETLAAWQRNPNTAHLGLAVNVSVQSFATDEFVPELARMIECNHVDATKLTLELTEHVMAKDQAAHCPPHGRPQADRDQAVARRFRHRLFVADLSEEAAVRRGQDRRRLRCRHREWRQRPRARQDDPGDGAHARIDRGGRTCRECPPGSVPEGTWMRLLPGLSLQQGGSGRAVPGAGRQADCNAVQAKGLARVQADLHR